MNKKLEQAMDKYISTRQLINEGEMLGYTEHEAKLAFRAAVDLIMPEAEKFVETINAVMNDDGLTLDQAVMGNKIICLRALKSWAEFRGEK